MLKAGEAHGITIGSKFEIYSVDISSLSNTPPIATARVIKTHYSTSDLKVAAPLQYNFSGSQSTTSDNSTTHKLLYALQIEAGSSEALPIHFTQAVSTLFENDQDWRATFDGNEGSHPTLVQSPRDKAHIIIDINECGQVTFETGNKIATSCGLKVLPYTMPAIIDEVLPVLRAAAKWAWHVSRTPDIPLPEDSVKIEFLQLDKGTRPGEFRIIGDRNQGGMVQLTYNDRQYYGVKLVNRTNIKLFPYLFYFDVSEQSIGEYTICRANSVHTNNSALQCAFIAHRSLETKGARHHCCRNLRWKSVTHPTDGNRWYLRGETWKWKSQC